MSRARIISLTRHSRNGNQQKSCHRCGHLLNYGDKVVSSFRANHARANSLLAEKTYTIYYHLKCFTDAKGVPIFK